MEKKKILERLIIDEDALLNQLVEKSVKIFAISKKSGNLIYMTDQKKLTSKEKAGLHLIGRYFASELGLKDSKYMDISELAKLIGTKEKSTTARLSELKKDNLIETPERGSYGISVANIPKFLDGILDKIEA